MVGNQQHFDRLRLIRSPNKRGQLIAAGLAAAAGREVMAVPSSPLDPRLHGYYELLRGGAALVQNAAEIAERVTPRDFRRRTRSTIGVEPIGGADGAAGNRTGRRTGARRGRQGAFRCLNFSPLTDQF